MFLEILQNSLENNCARVSFLPKLQFYQKRISGTGVSLEFRKISKNIFFTEHLRTTASGEEETFLVKSCFKKFRKIERTITETKKQNHITKRWILKRKNFCNRAKFRIDLVHRTFLFFSVYRSFSKVCFYKKSLIELNMENTEVKYSLGENSPQRKHFTAFNRFIEVLQ